MSAVWTGREMFVWYGEPGAGVRQGALYDPAADSWRPVASENAPSPRINEHTAVWTGSEVIVWGGDSPGYDVVGTGARYDPAANRWAAVSTVSAPWTNLGHSAVWTGTEMIIWRGSVFLMGFPNAAYDPSTDSWRAIPNAPLFRERQWSSAVWTGTEMLVWGGRSVIDDSEFDGARYDPATNIWAPMSTVGVPGERARHTAVWTGTEMIIWGGQGVNYSYGAPVLSTGGRYRPRDDRWRLTRSSMPPASRVRGHSTVWTGTEMIVFGGINDVQISGPTAYKSGAAFDPLTSLWTALPTWPGSFVRDHSVVWTGSEFIVWGGWQDGSPTSMGASYAPIDRRWTELPTSPIPTGRSRHAAVWTGRTMLVWGGDARIGAYLADGAEYDPSTQTWTMLPGSGLSARADQATAWTGTKMLVWGGIGSTGAVGDGALYDPQTRMWQSVTTNGAPSARSAVSSIWTGDRFLIWGGLTLDPHGGAYDPATDTWQRMSASGAPGPRVEATPVWTGNRMIVWGGRVPYDPHLRVCNDGGRYDPVSDTWVPTTLDVAPVARSRHSAVWTGTSMLIWGGIWAPGSSYAPDCTPQLWYADRDGDGYGDRADAVEACRAPAGRVDNGDDCNDTDPAIHPGAEELCDGVDNDCSGRVDDGLPINLTPADGATVMLPADRPEFTWTTGSCGRTYRLEFAADREFDAPVVHYPSRPLTEPGWQPGPAECRLIERLAGGSLVVYWRVVATGDNGWSETGVPTMLDVLGSQFASPDRRRLPARPIEAPSIPNRPSVSWVDGSRPDQQTM